MEDRHQKTAYPLRMPDEMRERLDKSAKEVGRSLNAEIVARLQQSLEPTTAESSLDLLSLLQKLSAHAQTYGVEVHLTFTTKSDKSGQ